MAVHHFAWREWPHDGHSRFTWFSLFSRPGKLSKEGRGEVGLEQRIGYRHSINFCSDARRLRQRSRIWAVNRSCATRSTTTLASRMPNLHNVLEPDLIGIEAAVARGPLPHHRAYGSEGAGPSVTHKQCGAERRRVRGISQQARDGRHQRLQAAVTFFYSWSLWPKMFRISTPVVIRRPPHLVERDSSADHWKEILGRRVGQVNEESFPIQDEPEAGACFQYKMSLEG